MPEQRERSWANSFSTIAYGDSFEEIKLAAMEKASAFLGPDLQLEVPDVCTATFCVTDKEKASGKRFFSRVTVRTVESDDGR